MFEERYQGAGVFELHLSPSAPDAVRFPEWSVSDDHDHRLWSWIVITPNRLPVDGLSANTVFGASQFTGAIRSFDVDLDGAVTLAGPSISVLLGDENGIGPSREVVWGDGSAGTRTFSVDFWTEGPNALFASANRRVNGLRRGTVFDDFTYTRLAFGLRGRPESSGIRKFADYPVTSTALRTELERINQEAQTVRVNPDRTVDIGLPTGSMFRQTPRALVWDGPSMTDGDIAVLRATELTYHVDADSFATYSRYHYNTGFSDVTEGSTFPGGATNPSPPYKDIAGSNTLRMDVNDGSESITTAADALSERRLNQERHALTHEIVCRVESRPDLRRFLRAGDMVWISAPRMGILDVTDQVVAGGKTLNPRRFRCIGLRRPITSGMGVYIIGNFTQTVVDASDWVQWEDGPTTIEVGKPAGKARTLRDLVGVRPRGAR